MTHRTSLGPWVGALMAAALALPGAALAGEDDDDEGGEDDGLIEELFVAETVYPQEKGEFQLTVMPARRGPGAGLRLNELTVFTEYGLTDWLQVEVGWGALQRLRDPARPEVDPQVSLGTLEWGLRAATRTVGWEGLWLSGGGEMGIPLGSGPQDGGEDGGLALEPVIILGQDLGPRNHLVLNLGLETPLGAKDPGEARDVGLAGALGWIFAPTERWRGTLELSADAEAVDGERELGAYLTPGILYEGIWELEVGLGAPLGLTDESAPWAVVGMVTFER